MTLPFSLPAVFSRKNTALPISDAVRDYHEQNIRVWKDIYSGNPPWMTVRKGGISGGHRKMNLLNLAKSICSEMTRLVFSDELTIEGNNADFVKSVFKDNSFNLISPSFFEEVFALGGGVIKAYAMNGKVSLDYVSADSFIPVSFDEKGVYSGIIISKPVRDGKQLFLCEFREFADGTETVKNLLFDCNMREIPLKSYFPDLADEIRFKNLKSPLFVYFRPAGLGGDGVPLGKSVFAEFTDVLRSADTVFDSLQREFVLGRKRIIVPSCALRGEYDENGNMRKYFDETDEVWQAFSYDDAEALRIVDNTSDLRVEEHVEALQKLTDIASNCCGLAETAVNFSYVTRRTAAEINAQNSKGGRTKMLHQQVFSIAVSNLCAAVAALGKLSGNIPVLSDGTPPNVSFIQKGGE